jgi:hypothetical protein
MGRTMNFIFTWILDRFGFIPRATLEFPIEKPVTVKPTRKAAKKVVRKTVRKKA